VLFGCDKAKMSTPTCTVCTKPVYQMELLQYDKGTYHKNCFKCLQCKSTITNLKSVAMISGDLYCKVCFMKVFKEKGKYSSFNDRPHTGSTVTNPNDGKEPSSPPVKETSPPIKESSPTLQIQRPTRSQSAQPEKAQPIQSSPQLKLKHVELPSKQNNTNEAKAVFEMPKRHVDPPKDLVEPKKQQEQPVEQQQQPPAIRTNPKTAPTASAAVIAWSLPLSLSTMVSWR